MTASIRCWMGCATNWTIRTPGSHQEQQERQRSGISTLRWHRTFGYFLAVSKAKAAVPDHWIRRQTLANEERFITPDLKEREGRIFQLRARRASGNTSCSASYASRWSHGCPNPACRPRRCCTRCPHRSGRCGRQRWLHRTNHHRQPRAAAGGQPTSGGRATTGGNGLHPNDVQLGDGTDLVVLTGPNEWQKLLSAPDRPDPVDGSDRQLVPARSATVGIADRIFTRVLWMIWPPASPLSWWRWPKPPTSSTTQVSVPVLLDEIGRGATFDGLDRLGRGEHLAGDLGSRTVFATHYHELNNLASERDNVANFQVLVEEPVKIWSSSIRCGPAAPAAATASKPPAWPVQTRRATGPSGAGSASGRPGAT